MRGPDSCPSKNSNRATQGVALPVELADQPTAVADFAAEAPTGTAPQQAKDYLMPRNVRIIHANLNLEGLGAAMGADDYRSALEQSWIGGTRITHEANDWLLSKPTHFSSNVWTGHFGFVLEDDLPTVEWDEETSEFLQRNLDRGTAFPFMVDTSKRLLSIQLFGSRTAAALTQRLKALLDENGVHYWSINLLVRRMTFEQWRTTVSGITEIKARLERPNPKWKNKPQLQELVAQTNSGVVRLEAKSSPHEFVNMDSDWGRELLDHVSDGYGSIDVVGRDVVTAEESRLQLDQSLQGSIPEASQEYLDDEARELPSDQMRELQETVIEQYTDDDSIIQ